MDNCVGETTREDERDNKSSLDEPCIVCHRREAEMTVSFDDGRLGGVCGKCWEISEDERTRGFEPDGPPEGYYSDQDDSRYRSEMRDAGRGAQLR